MEVKKFWNFTEGTEEGRVLRFEGVIAAECWFGDEITPAMFRSELNAGKGNLTIWLNSIGGDCVAASQIYAMLMDYKGNVTVKIDGLAASAASVIAMSGTKVLMSPTAQIMIHNPWSFAIGDSEEMRKAAAMLDSTKESIMNAYEIKTGLSRKKLSKLMDAESFFDAHAAIELGFADGMLERNPAQTALSAKPAAIDVKNHVYSRKAMNNVLINKVLAHIRSTEGKPPQAQPPTAEAPPESPQGIPFESLNQRLNLILH